MQYTEVFKICKHLIAFTLYRNKSRLIDAFRLVSAFKILTKTVDVIGLNDVIIITKQFN